MSDDAKVLVEIGATVAGLKSGMDQATNLVKEGVEGIKGHLEGMVGIIEKVGKGFAALTAIAAGGAMFAEAIAETRKITGEAIALGKILGTTTTEASIFSVALSAVGGDADSAKGAVMALTRSLNGAPEKFEKLGVALKDNNGQMRSMQDILLDVTEKFRGMADGTAKNMAMAQIFGRQWMSMGPIMKLTAEGMAEARVEAEELNLIVGKENVEAAIKYKIAMNGMKEVSHGMTKSIGDAMLPILTDLANWFRKTGPGAVTATKVAINGLATVIRSLGIGLETFREVVHTVFSSVAIGAVTMADVVAKAIRWDFAGAKAALEEGGLAMQANFKKHAAKFVEINAEGQKKIDAIWAKPTATKMKEGEEAPDLKRSKKGGGKEKDMASALFALDKATLEAKFSLEKDALKREELLYKDQYAKNLISIEEYYADSLSTEMALLTKEHDLKQAEIDAANARMKAAEAKKGPEGEKEIILVRTQLVKLTADLTINERNQADASKNNAIKRLAAEQSLANKMEDIVISNTQKLAETRTNIEEANAQQEIALRGGTQAEVIALEAEFENRRNLIARTALLERLDMEMRNGGPKDPVAIAKLNSDIEALEAGHVEKMVKIANKGVLEQQQGVLTMMASVKGGFEKSISGLIDGTMTWKTAMQNIWTSIIQAFGQFVAKKVVLWAVGETQKTTATVAGNEIRTASDWAAAAQSTLATAWSVIKNIAARAWEVAASVYAAIAAIPVVGPFLAPVMAVAAGAAVIGFASHVASASGGYDIPAGTNPMTQLHEKEMVLPAKHADVIRSLADSGSGGNSSGGPTITYNDHSGTLTPAQIQRNVGVIAKALMDHSRKQSS
jgi:hypothetical protein